MALTKVITDILDDSIRIGSGSLNVISGSKISTGSFGRLQTHQANALLGSRTVTLGGDLTTAGALTTGGALTTAGTFTTQNNNVTINAVGAARTLTLNESLTVGDGNDGTITFSGASKTLTVEDTSLVNQDLTSDASPTFAAGTITGNLSVGGTLTAQEIHTEFTSASIMFSSGSTKFGDTIDDTHEVTGSMTMSGSVTVNDGNLTVTDNVDFNGDLDVDGTTNLDNTDIDGTLTVAGGVARFSRADTSPAGTDPHGIFDDGVFGSTDTTNTGITIFGSGQTSLAFGDAGDSDIGQVRYQHSTNKLEFLAAANIRMVVSGSGNVGIGTNAPVRLLDLVAPSDAVALNLRMRSADDFSFITFTDNDAGEAFIGQIASKRTGNGAGEMQFYTSGDNLRMVINNSGLVGIGTDNPAKTFHVEKSVGGDFVSRIRNSDGTNGEALNIKTNNTTTTSRLLHAENSNGRVFTIFNDAKTLIGNNDGFSAASASLHIAQNEPTIRLQDMNHASDTYVQFNANSSAASLEIEADGANKKSDTTIDFRIDGDGIARLDNFGNLGIGPGKGFTGGVGFTSGTHNHRGGANSATLHISGSVPRILLEDSGDDPSYVIEAQNYFAVLEAANDGTSETTRFRINSDGRVGIGCSDQEARLQVNTGVSDATIAAIDVGIGIEFNGGSGGHVGMAVIDGSAGRGKNRGFIGFRGNSASSMGHSHIVFGTADGVADDPTERMRIETGGNVGIGTNNPGFPLEVEKAHNDWLLRLVNSVGSGNAFAQQISFSGVSPNNTAAKFQQFVDGGSTVRFEVRSNGGVASFQSNDADLSDESVKKDIVDASNCLDTIKNIKVRNFKYKDQTDDRTLIGVIAQEVEAVNSSLVDDSEDLKRVYNKDIMFMMLKSIQELSEKNDTLEKRIEELEK